jgi:hypothetical protein
MRTTTNVDSPFLEQKHTSAGKTTFFDREETPAFVYGESQVIASISVPDDVSEKQDELVGRLITRVLLNQGPGGFSLLESDVAPGTRVPRHKHNLPQVALILEGSMRQGNRVLGPGAGYYTPADQAYTFVAGPEGCRYVEFRVGAVEEITAEVVEKDPERFAHES